MPNHDFGRCDGHHKMVDCIGLAPGDFPIRTRELEIDRKKMTGQIGRSTFVSPVACGYTPLLHPAACLELIGNDTSPYQHFRRTPVAQIRIARP